jgi:hypothetical protein
MSPTELNDAHAESTRVAVIFDSLCPSDFTFLGPQMDRAIDTSAGIITISHSETDENGNRLIWLGFDSGENRKILLEKGKPQPFPDLGIELLLEETRSYTDPTTGSRIRQPLEGVCVRRITVEPTSQP